jgi:hypothetical protein
VERDLIGFKRMKQAAGRIGATNWRICWKKHTRIINKLERDKLKGKIRRRGESREL